MTSQGLEARLADAYASLSAAEESIVASEKLILKNEQLLQEALEQAAQYKRKYHKRTQECRELEAAYAMRTAKWKASEAGYARRKELQKEAEAKLQAIYKSKTWLAGKIARAGYHAITLRSWRTPKPVIENSQPANSCGAMGKKSNPSFPPVADVVVCVHNALEDVQTCLKTVISQSPSLHRLIIIDDGSDQITRSFLEQFAANNSNCIVIRNDTAEGYTKAANRGLRATSAQYVVLLNSDTIVSRGWLTRLIRCAASSPSIGIVGPLSNAASWQSVPERFDCEADWAVNALPPGMTIRTMARLLISVSRRRYPHVPFLNGFCLLFTRAVIDEVGFFDEECFPNGYGEENDYCVRARSAGFDLVIADDTYVYHAKSKSYCHDRRLELARQGRAAFDSKHGTDEVPRGSKHLRWEPTLHEIRARLRTELENNDASILQMKVLFLLPVKGGGGGVHSIVQETVGLRSLGIVASVAVPRAALSNYHLAYPTVDRDIFIGFRSIADLESTAAQWDVAVATIFTSVALLEFLIQEHPQILPAYYIQDYEPWICQSDDQLVEEARQSYTKIPDMVRFAKTKWLCETIEALHGVPVKKVIPSLDTSVYFPNRVITAAAPLATVRVSAMVRPRTPRRAPDLTMKILRELKTEYNDKIEITTFGCEPDEADFLRLDRSFDFDHRGLLTREGVAEILRANDIFLDLSTYQAFGRTALEAMACGCAVIVPQKGGATEYAVHGVNSMVVDTSDSSEILKAASQLIKNDELRERLRKSAQETASQYSISRASASLRDVFEEALS